MHRLRLGLLLTACFVSQSGAFVPAAVERQQLLRISTTTTTHESSRRAAWVRAPPANPQERRPRHGMESKVFSAAGDGSTRPEESSAAAAEEPGSRRRGAPPATAPRRLANWRSWARRALFDWIPSFSLSMMRKQERPTTLNRRESLGMGVSRVRGTTKRLAAALLLAFFIWQRSPSSVLTATGHHPSGGNVAHATTSERSRAGNWMTRVIPRSTQSARGSTGSNKVALTVDPTSSSSATVIEAPSGTGGEGASVRPASSSSFASVVLTTTAVATAGAGTTTIVLRRRSKEARRFLQKQGERRRAFQSNLKRAVLRIVDSEDQGDNRILAKRFRFLRAKDRDGGDDDQDVGIDEVQPLRVGGAVNSSPEATASRNRPRSNHLVRKKSEEDYIQDLLNRVKQNVAVPSMRRTERSVAARAAELHPHEKENGELSASKQPGAASNSQSVVQSLKSISSLSTSTLDIDEQVEGDDDPLGTSTVSIRTALETQTVEVPSPGTKDRVFLHDVDAAYALAFDSAGTTADGARYLHYVDEAYARAFEAEGRLPTVSLGESTIQKIHEGVASASPFKSLHPVDEAFAHAFRHAEASSAGVTSTEVPAVPMNDMSDLSLIGGEISATLWEENLDNSDVEEMSDVVERFAAIVDDSVAPPRLETTADLEQAATQVDDGFVAIPVENVSRPIPSEITPNVRVIESLESLVESPDEAIASAAADVLTEVEAASDLADQLKMLRKGIDTTATTVDDEVDDSETGASVENIAADILVGDADPEALNSSDSNLDTENLSPEVALASSTTLHNEIELPTKEDLGSDEAETFYSTEGNDSVSELDPGSVVLSFSGDDTSPEITQGELETDIQSEKSVAAIASGRSTLPDEAVDVGSSSEFMVTVADPQALPMVAADVEDTKATASGGSRAGEVVDNVGTFPAWIRERVRSKRQHQRDRSRAKKMKQTHEMDSARHVGVVEVGTTLVASTTTNVPLEEKKDVHSQVDTSEQMPAELFNSAPIVKEKLAVSTFEHSTSIPALRTGSKKRRNKRLRQVPQNSAEAEALSRKYAAIPTLEERAFAILKDLGMLEPLEDTEA